MNIIKRILLYINKCVVMEPTYKIYDPCNRGKNVSIGEGTKIGAFCELGDGVIIGENCNIQAFVYIPSNVIIMDDVFIGPSVIFTNDKYPPSKGKWKNDPPTIVKSSSIIGAGSIIMPNLVIGYKSVIGAGSLVTKNIPPNELWYGNPARFVRKI